MKTFWLICLLLSPSLSLAMNAQQVMKSVEQKNSGLTSYSQSSMVLEDKRGNLQKRTIKSLKRDDSRQTKEISYFLSPPELRDTSYLIHDDHRKSVDDSWIYLPSMRKVKRIVSTEKSGAFLGSDFSYADLSGLKEKNWNFSFNASKTLKDSGTVKN